MNDLLNIEKKILVIRGQQVMLDRDLADLYGIETKNLNKAMSRNKDRFPDDFCFKLTMEEFSALRFHFGTSRTKGGRRYLPYAFTEQGVAMLSAVLRSKIAIQVSIAIMNAFVKMRHYLLDNAGIITRLTQTEIKLLEHDKNFEKIFSAMNTSPIPIKQKVFSHGEVFDAYSFFQGLIQRAQKEIILVDNYIDLTVLERLSKKNPGVNVTIYTLKSSPIKQIDLNSFNTQYPILTLRYTSKTHDRFLILDNKEIYHIGASIKDLGKKCFAFTKFEDAKNVIQLLLNML